MKRTRVSKKIFGLGSVLTLSVGLISFAAASPGSPSSARPDSDPSMNSAPAADNSAMACVGCKTVDVWEFHSSNAGGKMPAHAEIVGFKHTCFVCGTGSITVIRGKVVANDMKSHCMICAKTAPGCCGVSGKVAAAN